MTGVKDGLFVKQIGDFDMLSSDKTQFGEKLWNLLKVSTGS